MHVEVVTDTAAELILNLLSMNSQLSIVYEVLVPQHLIHPLSPLNDPFLNEELTILTQPFITTINDSIGTLIPSPMNQHDVIQSNPAVL
ncbi:MAG: hypothetical protein EZS28_026565 [Streblomastix strix]|uniref:Uncharacterized protein n=1 Tax=Streblomastix strix TaxID=222440 RepID=A0A5J4V530_9EUKA|nr:MAG: hypothetical protein EZS28_026565 [Streblomastix strix]